MTWVHWGASRLVSRPLLGVTLRGQTGALRHGVVLLRLRRPCGVSVPPQRSLNAAAKNAAQTSFGPRQESTPWHLGAGPTRLASPSVTRAGYGKFNETEITTMYSNKVTLIGFLGNDAEVRTNNDRSLTTLSLATKSSYKKDGKYIEHTEWHRCVVFGKLGEFAAKLQKGAHIQVEGELRSRKYDSTKTGSEVTVWEIRLSSILKLDRAQKAAAEDDEEVTEEEAS
jgi:single-strand DNA-binding protein